MKSLKNFKLLKASSVLESVIAISIISICALVAFMVYLNIIRHNKSIAYFNARHSISLLIQQSIEQKDYESNDYTFTGYSIKKQVDVNETEHTALLTFTYKTGNKTNVINKLIAYNE
ncbi:hypothetical protein Q4Q35_04140 [Flavivirga aquimarina]|uniref:Type II secretion system protein n=1 Tax=Flavivirga aquimarina TaxID=2027862 RepID=A0ABT8W792_9FLAO|nr:hypothetical protein [Flavivirga aquimarina]MDO5968989.1 hypothetical protein [Flavivirga aquimarina]